MEVRLEFRDEECNEDDELDGSSSSKVEFSSLVANEEIADDDVIVV